MKEIRNASDLAINGAPPAFCKPLHVGQPNVGDQEAFLNLTKDILDRAWFTNNGPLVQEFESQIEKHLGVRNCVAMCNGTIALEIAIRAVGMGGEVIVPSFTFIATAHALHWQGITPIFADIDPETHNLDPDAVRAAITPRTTGIIGVHLWGRPAPIDDLQSLADEYGIELLFDAAHAFGCTYNMRSIGNFGRAEVFSFHATKFFNTMEGGAVVTNDDELAESMKLMRNFGFSGYDNVIYPGTNGKMMEICGAMGMINLDALEDVVETNRHNHAAYTDALDNLPGVDVLKYSDAEECNYQYVVLEISEECPVTRDQIIQVLHAENVLARRYFWPGCHRMEPYKTLFPKTGLLLPYSEHLSEKVITLPTGKMIDESAIHSVSSTIKTFVQGRT